MDCDQEVALLRGAGIRWQLQAHQANDESTPASRELLSQIYPSLNADELAGATETLTELVEEEATSQDPRLPLSTFITKEGLQAPFPIEAVHWSGDPRFRLNLVILADGYQAEELPQFRSSVARMVRQLTRELPFRDFAGQINIIRADVPSKESGASCDDDKFSRRKTRYGSAFLGACLNASIKLKLANRGVYQMNAARVRKDALAIRYQGLSIADQVHVLVNSPKYGGMTLLWWSSSTAGSGPHTAIHEIGHSFGGLGDEYALDGDPCLFFMAKSPNVSIRKPRGSLKWKSWLDDDTPVPTPNSLDFEAKIGLFQGAGGGCQKVLYRPALECKMNSDESKPFCQVCQEQLTLRLYDRILPIQGTLESDHDTVHAPIMNPERYRTRWLLNGKPVQESLAYEPLRHTPREGDLIRLLIFDQAADVRRDQCRMFFAAERMF